MNSLYKDGMSIIMKKIGLLCGCILVVLILSAMTWGKDVISLLEGPQPFDTIEPSLVDGSKEHEELTHEYVSISINMITGSYAQYGEMKEQQMDHQTVYYLMPVKDGSYFITVIAHGDSVISLDAMEKAFYNSIGKEEKEYPETMELQAGLKQLNNEELEYALDYFSSYDETIKIQDQLPNILSPYAIVIDEIGSISVSSLWILLIAWVILSVVCIIGILLYLSKIFMHTLTKDITELSEEHKEILDEDYRKAICIDSLKIGNHLLYKKESWTWRVWEYDRFIWIYKKEILSKKLRQFEVCIFDRNGKKFTLWTGEDEKKTQKVLQKVFDHCSNALLGYESYIFEYWKEQPKKLCQKLQELELIKQKEIAFIDQKENVKKKERKKNINKKRKELKEKEKKHDDKKQVDQTKEKTKQKAEKKKKELEKHKDDNKKS